MMNMLGRNGRNLLSASRICSRLLHSNSMLLAPVKIGMPSLSPTMESGTIISWAKKEGDELVPGDLLCEVQTDKAVVGMETDEEGFLAKIIRPEGSVNNVGDPIAVLALSDEDWKAVAANAEAFIAAECGGAAMSETITSSKNSPVSNEARTPIGPAVRLLLSSYGLTANQVSGTGPKGTVLKGDVLGYVSGKNLQKVPQQATTGKETNPPASVTTPTVSSSRPIISGTGFVDLQVSGMRATIAKRLCESKSTIPHTYTRLTLCSDRLLALRKAINSKDGVNVSVNDLIIKACAYALRLVPELNGTANASGSAFHRSAEVDICVAVSTPTGLITPIVPSADTLPLSSISSLVKELAGKAKDNKLQPNEFTGGSFTISNLGMFGVREFTAIINPPQVAILAVGGSQQIMTANPIGDGSLMPSTNLTLTLSTDARFVDEVKAGAFLRHVQRFFESDSEALLFGDVKVLADDDLLSIMTV